MGLSILQKAGPCFRLKVFNFEVGVRTGQTSFRQGSDTAWGLILLLSFFKHGVKPFRPSSAFFLPHILLPHILLRKPSLLFLLSLCIAGHHCFVSSLQVVVLTHAYGDRTGVRYMTNGLKVYYIPRLPFYAQSTFPTIYGTLPIVRVILIRERITVIHGHQVRVSIEVGVNACVPKRWCQFWRNQEIVQFWCKQAMVSICAKLSGVARRIEYIKPPDFSILLPCSKFDWLVGVRKSVS